MDFEHAMLDAEHGFRVKRADWQYASVTGDGEGGFLKGDEPYEATDEDIAATDWSRK